MMKGAKVFYVIMDSLKIEIRKNIFGGGRESFFLGAIFPVRIVVPFPK